MLLNIIEAKGGSNTPLLYAKYNGIRVVVKQFGFIPKVNANIPHIKLKDFLIIRDDWIQLHHTLAKCKVALPKCYQCYFIKDKRVYLDFAEQSDIEESTNVRFIVFEKYCGVAITKALSEMSTKNKDVLLQKCHDLIYKMPENIEIDTNPNNFTILQNRIYFVDMMPPKICDYQSNRVYTKLFPQIKIREHDRELRRRFRYFTTEGRIRRFQYYLKQI